MSWEWAWRLVIISWLAMHALHMKDVHAAEWTPADTKREIAVTIVRALDWGQTRYIAQHPDKFYERNPILGRHPSVNAVDTYFAVTTSIHWFMAKKLNSKNRKRFQYVFLVFGALNVANNYRVGVRIGF